MQRWQSTGRPSKGNQRRRGSKRLVWTRPRWGAEEINIATTPGEKDRGKDVLKIEREMKRASAREGEGEVTDCVANLLGVHHDVFTCSKPVVAQHLHEPSHILGSVSIAVHERVGRE